MAESARSRPALFTFDILGTVIDWERGLSDDCRAAGRALAAGEFDRIVDAQGALERGAFLDYASVTARSLVETIGLDAPRAAVIGASLGDWPPFADSPASLDALGRIAPCAAMTNSDRTQGVAIRARLGVRLDPWLCAEEVRRYKPDPAFWAVMGERRGIAPGPAWWHVSAYADYDLEVANALGLTTVLVRRPHHRPGPSTFAVDDLAGLLALAEC